MRFQNQELKKIGSGEFSTAYRVIDSDIVYIFTKTNDIHANNNTKEVYTHIEGKHIPYMSSVDQEVYMNRVGYVNIYETRYYAPLTAKNQEAWRIYRTLQKTWESVLAEHSAYINTVMGGEYVDRYKICRIFIDTLQENESVPDSIIEALDAIYGWATAYGSGFLFEFPKWNLRVDSNGDLILLDILFYRNPTTDRKRMQNRW